MALLTLAFVFATVVVSATASASVTGAGFTTTNDNVDVTLTDPGPHCLNGNPAVNCNIYTGKQYVWLNGGPNTAQPGAGTYFFAVLVPGGQGGHDNPNDGTPKNLSDLSPTSNTGAGDDWTHRVFSIASDGTITYPASGYPGGHDFDSNKIRLMPYDDTTNPGGVYIMAICNLDGPLNPGAFGPPGVDPSLCKYDAFKVRPASEPPPPPNQVASCFSGTKYRDDNKNGQFDDATEVGLANWTITLDPGTPLDSSDDLTATTDANGNWSVCEAPHDPVTGGTTTYTVSETLKSSWKQTGNTVDQTIVLGGATVSLSGKVYTVTVPQDANASADGLNFGNIPQGTVDGDKYYDSNQNGSLDLLEPFLGNWPITQGGSASANLLTAFSVVLDPGTYTFTEVQATNGWIQTGNTTNQSSTTGGATVGLSNKVYTVTIPVDQPSTVTGLHFGNVCNVVPGGLTMGFWSNNNGQALITSGDIAALVALNLRTATGTDFNPANKAAYKNWLLSANATSMSYMLSAQMSATYLDLQHGFVTNPGAIVDGTRNTAQEIQYANSLLTDAIDPPTADGKNYTPSGDPLRAEQERVKNILNTINNGGGFIQPTPDTCPSPTFP